MKIFQILPEMHEGGVERHVLWLSNELAAMGHDVTVVSAGGKLEGDLKGVKTTRLPVHLKNPVTALYSALAIAWAAKREKADIIHAHSRVPAWIAWWASRLAGKPFIITAHAVYRLNWALVPFSRANLIICVSETVRAHLLKKINNRAVTIFNGLGPVNAVWNESSRANDEVRFLFVGRLTRKKGLHLVIEALSQMLERNWILDVVGDGPEREELEEQAKKLCMSDRVFFHGFRDDTDEWMLRCSCFLFPSTEEGMGLTLMRAVQMGVPVLASDIPAARELLANQASSLISPTVSDWKKAMSSVVEENDTYQHVIFSKEKIITINEMAKLVMCYYGSVLKITKKN